MWNKEMRLLAILSFVLVAASSVTAQTQELPKAAKDKQQPAKDKAVPKDDGPPILMIYTFKGNDAKKHALALETTYKSSPTVKIAAIDDKQIKVYAARQIQDEILGKLNDVARAVTVVHSAKSAQKVSIPSLEEALTKALKQNPDILVAIAKVRGAEAELNQVRQSIMGKIVSAFADIEATSAIVEEVLIKYERLMQLRAKVRPAVTDEEFGEAKAIVLKYKAELASKRAELPPLIGAAGGEAPSSQEDALAKARKQNPDILVAESKVRLAEAELNRTQQQVLAKIQSTYAEIDAIRAILDEAENRWERLKALRGIQKSVADDDLGAAKATALKYKAELAKAQAGLPYLIGKDPATFTDFSDVDSDVIWLSQPIVRVDYNIPNAEKVRKALDMPITVNIDSDIWFSTVLAMWQDSLQKGGIKGLNLFEFVGGFMPRVKLDEPVTLATALQLIEDHSGMRFVIRDYGIVGMATKNVPPGALLVSDFVKRGKEKQVEPQKK